jgi:hypothetical protein
MNHGNSKIAIFFSQSLFVLRQKACLFPRDLHKCIRYMYEARLSAPIKPAVEAVTAAAAEDCRLQAMKKL